MWFGVWASRRRGETRWKEFIERYYKFLPEDVVLICDSHHAEIHSIYDTLIARDKAWTQRKLSDYTWSQAVLLMNKLEQACIKWLGEQTPGISSAEYGERRKYRKA
jgi:hypothetical protein